MRYPKNQGGVDLHGLWLGKENLLAQNGGSYSSFSPTRVVLPMGQHAGAPAKPLVEKGDHVSMGQKIAEEDGKMSAPVHASVSGVVIDVGEAPLADGPGLAVTIENDGKDTLHGDVHPPDDRDAPTRETILTAIQEGGIVGMGGATFSTSVKLDTEDKPIDMVLLNGAECEPGLSADNALMQARAADILEGAKLALQVCGATRCVIGIEENKPGAIHAMKALEQRNALEVRTLPPQYPQGGEKQLIYSLTGREVPEDGLPADVGVVVLNVATAAAIRDAVMEGRPLTHRLATVTGDVAKPQNLLYPLGSPAQELIAHCGGYRGTPSKIILGGPMMGQAVADPAAPLTKGTNGLIVLNTEHDIAYTEQPCIRCNRCVESCPMALVPYSIDRYYRKESWKHCHRLRATSCISCGCCTYICPATRNLAENIVAAKGKVTSLQKEGKL